MSLQEQFQIIIFSFLYSIIFIATYNLLNRLTYKIKGHILRLFLELSFFTLHSLLFFYVLLKLNNAILSIYIPLAFIAGILFYLKFLSFHTLLFYEHLIKYLKKKMLPVKKHFQTRYNKVKEKIKKIRGRINEKIRKRRRKKQNQKEPTDPNHPNSNHF